MYDARKHLLRREGRAEGKTQKREEEKERKERRLHHLVGVGYIIQSISGQLRCFWSSE